MVLLKNAFSSNDYKKYIFKEIYHFLNLFLNKNF